MELAVLLRLLIAHILADFFLQPLSWVRGKREHRLKARFIYQHVLIVGVATYLLLGNWVHWQLPLFIMASHFFIDWWKATHKDTVTYFIIDQTAHLLIIIGAWLVYSGQPIDVWSYFPAETLYPLLVVFAAYLAIMRPSGFLIEKFTGTWRDEMEAEDISWPGLNRAGTWIGYLERFIILTFILLNQYSGIGFLIAAKSIFRFPGAVKNKQERMYAEYILIGTLVSFSLALLAGIGMNYLLGL